MNSQSTDNQSAIVTIALKKQLWVGETEKLSMTVSHEWLVLVEISQFT